MPFTVSEGAVKLELNIEPGAIVLSGVEQGGIQTDIQTPWWAYLIFAVLGIGWLVTKFRRHTTKRTLTREMPPEKESKLDSFLDVFF
jgi:hypothetical protein